MGPSGFLQHRGPDEQSYFRGANYEVEFSRLTITGTKDGEVPVSSGSNRWLVAFNGEIYNFKKLISTYSLPFTDSDTRTIAEGLDKIGISFFSRLRGMYAGVAIDTVSNRFYIFRDPLGEKPLFYNLSSQGLSIASEFTALLKLLNRPLALNLDAVSDFFRFGYVEEPHTFDLEIHSVKRGVVLRVLEDSSFEEVLQLHGFDNEETSLPLPQMLRILQDEDSVTSVPTGLALSAGIDSTSLFNAMVSARDREFVPIIMNIDSSGYSSEARDAIQACVKLGVTPKVLNYSDEHSLSLDLARLAVLNDQPHSDPSGLSYLRIFEASRAIGLKVIILGHGPDELFWGYPWFNEKLSKFLEKGEVLSKSERVFWDNPSTSKRLLWNFANSRRHTAPSEFSSDSFLVSSDPWERFRAEMTHSYLSSNGLRQSDRLAMASSVEPRTPYADSRLYGWAQVNSKKISTSFNKAEFRNAVDLGHLETTRFRKKEGFISPMGDWFRIKEVSDLTESYLELLNKDYLEWRIKPRMKFLSPSEKYKVVMLGGWLSQFN